MDRRALGGRIRNARTRAKLTQLDVAHALGTQASTVSKWEAGLWEPSLSFVDALARTLKVRLEWLVRGPRSRKAA